MAEDIDQEALQREISDLENRLKHAKSLLKDKDTSHNENKLYDQLTRDGTDIPCGESARERRTIDPRINPSLLHKLTQPIQAFNTPNQHILSSYSLILPYH